MKCFDMRWALLPAVPKMPVEEQRSSTPQNKSTTEGEKVQYGLMYFESASQNISKLSKYFIVCGLQSRL